MFDSFPENTTAFIPIRLLNPEGVPVPGVGSSSVTVTLLKPDGVAPVGNITIDGVTNKWLEYTFGAYLNQGVYGLTLGGANLNQVGQFVVAITGGGGSAVAEITVMASLPSDVMTRLGTPSGASIEADIASIKSDTTAINTNVLRALGLLKANSVLDQQVYNPAGQLLTARLRCYDSAADATTATNTGLLFQYSVTATYTTGQLTNFVILQVT